jgi:hypothetical protein
MTVLTHSPDAQGRWRLRPTPLKEEVPRQRQALATAEKEMLASRPQWLERFDRKQEKLRLGAAKASGQKS